MAVAAGGRITQTIVRDPYAPSRWEAGPPIVFNVQVLNSACFESVTGEAALQSPVDAKTYADLGYPFFDMYEEPSGITGNFAQVKSVAELDDEEETHYTPATKKIKLASGEEGKIIVKDEAGSERGKAKSNSDSLLNPNGPISVFRPVSEIEAELKQLKLND
jgi:hypothetical protein